MSPEAPVLVLSADREEVRLGGAASVAALLRGLEAEVILAGVVGDDSAGRALLRLLDEAGIDRRLVSIDPNRPTTTKERFIGRAANKHAHQILRVDRESCLAIDSECEETLGKQVLAELPNCQALLISDYAKGVCTPGLLQAVIRAANDTMVTMGGALRGVPVLVDPARGAEYGRYRRASVIKPNRVEASQAWNCPIESPQQALAAGKFLCREFNLGAAVVTLDQEGMALTVPGKPGVVFPTKARSVYDITGAGDMSLAMLGLCQAAGLELGESVELANTAAGLQVERLGVEPISRREIRGALVPDFNQERSLTKVVAPADLVRLGLELRQAGRKIVFTNGCFDLLHVGHVTYLEQAAALGDALLIVGVNSDAGVRRLKGPSRSIIGQADRAAMLAALACVGHVVIFDDDTPHALLRSLRPDVLVKGGTYTPAQVVGREVVDAYGGQVCVVGCVDGVSTTSILSSLAQRESSRKPLESEILT